MDWEKNKNKSHHPLDKKLSPVSSIQGKINSKKIKEIPMQIWYEIN